MESQSTVEPVDPAEPRVSAVQPPTTPGIRAHGTVGWLATPAIAILAVVCCAGPLLLGALAATGTAAWLGAHGLTLVAAALIVLAAALAWRIRARMSRE